MPPNMTLLRLEPESTLNFSKSPMTTSPNRMLKLINLHSGHVAFKVKTTAPKAYLVRPSSGTLRPGEATEVQIILQPQGTDGQANNHRFLVQAVGVNNAEPVSREQWAEFQKEAIQEQRLNVVLEEPGAETANKLEAPYGLGGGVEGSSRAPEGPADLKVKYDELVQYTLMLEKNIKKLEAEIATLNSKPGPSSVDGAGFSKVHLIIVALLGFLVSYLVKFLG